jgi:hypothetical protein
MQKKLFSGFSAGKQYFVKKTKMIFIMKGIFLKRFESVWPFPDGSGSYFHDWNLIFYQKKEYVP